MDLSLSRGMLNKVPQVTIFFWIIKILATTIGETGADFLNVNLGFGLDGTSVAMLGLLAVFLTIQMRKDRYVPWVFWVVVVILSVVGTLLTDNLTDKLGVSLYISTAAFAVALAITFAIWYVNEQTLSIHDIISSKREAFYWLAILFTFALGTAAGDLISEVALAIEMGADAVDLGHTIHPHPTLSETVNFAAEMYEGTITDLMPPKKRR